MCTLILLLSSSASADQVEGPTDPQVERARAHAQAGKAYFDEGKFMDAIRELEEAHALAPRPSLLYNIAQAWARLGDDMKTAAALRAYLAAAPDAADRASVERWLDNIRAPPPAAPQPQSSSLLPWIVGFGAASAVTGGVGLGLGLSAQSTYRELEGGCGASLGCSEAEIDTARAPATAANVLFGAASTFLLTSLVVLIVEVGR
ncbi:MAG: hypothetical protein HY791_38685 [Deltaproteobacteria bacterium]|nr:hypothetical protein [Deltaproteobacteria bacterium]